MNHHELAHRLAKLSAYALAAAFFFVTAAASAQATSASPGQGGASTAASTIDVAAKPTTQTEAVVEEEEGTYNLPLQVGDSTSNLFAWQRSGEIASKTPRQIAGNIAGRSYERYLKSFEFPIPERMNSTVKASTGSASTK
ncbi:hypothetical protein D3C87_971680 [compost metagenome]|uniref:DUF3613 domain-containing protein n=1 Tax=Variovorax boronicumulans TaxID=436515 RepID=A0A250DQU3_9BURK|nr:DUF3613 domain-containing protein [Variovorax boronicumulans]ATA56654.1 hypothetical protein CKY39_28045 [Variovorax boronicumulans]